MRGLRFVHGEKELVEKLGRNDPCPCGSGLRFQAALPELGLLLIGLSATSIGVTKIVGGGFVAKCLGSMSNKAIGG